MKTHPIIQEALSIIDNAFKGAPICGDTVETLWKRAHAELPKDVYKDQFMTCLNQIWKMA